MSDKKPSGAQYRKERRERARSDAQQSGNADKLVEQFTDGIGEDPDDTLESLDWVRRLQARALSIYIRDPGTSLREKFRAVKEMGDSIGKTENRRALETEVMDLREAVAALKQRRGGAKLEPADAIARPHTARSSRRGRGPRPVPGHGAGTEEREE